jgi:hypothetical protein
MIKFYFALILHILLNLAFCIDSFCQTFSNNTIQTHNSWDAASITWGTGTPLIRAITVSGLPSTLGSATVLKQINIRLGNSSNTGLNLSTYKMRLYHPDGTTFIDICSSGGNDCGGSSIGDVNIKYRDDATLRSIGQLPSGTPSAAWPYHIGYYRVVNAGSFSTFNGLNPNGNWELRIIEGTLTEITFRGVDLVFGVPFDVVDISTSTANDACSAAQCIDNAHVYRATNNGYLNPGPATDPGITVGTCSWNGAKNNTAWFYFTASGSTASVTISGLSAMLQSIGLSISGTCSAPTYSVPTGGCPNATVNNQYLGGASHGSSGMSYNHELNFSGLVTGQTYYVVVDGTGGAISPFYVEILGNTDPCTVILGNKLLSFNADKKENTAYLTWSTTNSDNSATEFIVERSTDGINFNTIGIVSVGFLKNGTIEYEFIDEMPENLYNYYRIKLLENDGSYSYSDNKVLYFDIENQITISPNPVKDELQIRGVDLNAHFKIIDINGQLIIEGNFQNSNKISTVFLKQGYYILLVEGYQAKFIIKD